VTDIYQSIRQAIIEKKIVVATYSGLVREMCPHVLGLKNGKQQALFYQFGGESKSRPIEPDGSMANWRCIELAKLSNIQLTAGPWHTAPNHSRPVTCVDQIDVEVQL
jgi:hypothetical protein